jgi:hypothetical protein
MHRIQSLLVLWWISAVRHRPFGLVEAQHVRQLDDMSPDPVESLVNNKPSTELKDSNLQNDDALETIQSLVISNTAASPKRLRQLSSNDCDNSYTAPPPLPGKRGIGLLLQPSGERGSYEENMPKVIALKPYWNYSWGSKRPPNQPNGIEFVPMIWGYFGVPSKCSQHDLRTVYGHFSQL